MEYDSNNIFSKILLGEISCNKVFENDFCLAFHDIHPAAKVHVICIPKKNVINFTNFINNSDIVFIGEFFRSINEIIDKLNLSNGYRLITNQGHDGVQSIHHFHVHILGGEALGPLVTKDLYHSNL